VLRLVSEFAQANKRIERTPSATLVPERRVSRSCATTLGGAGHVKRADSNRWGLVILLSLGAWGSIPVLAGIADMFYPRDGISALLFYGGLVLVTVVYVLAVRSVTNARRWWIVPLLASPAGLVTGLILLVNIHLYFGGSL